MHPPDRQNAERPILLTGAAGTVGRALRPLLLRRFGRLVLTDRRELPNPLATGETFERGDLEDAAFLAGLAMGSAGIVHLAGLVGAHYTFEQVISPNVVGTHHVFEAARAAGVRNVVLASSAHVVGFLRRGSPIDHATPPRPNSPYAWSKASAEAAGAYFADNFGRSVMAIRIGYVGDDLSKERRLRTWVSARDLAQLVAIGLTRGALGFEVVYGVSANPQPFFDNSNAFRLGYLPRDSSADVVTDPAIAAQEPDLATLEGGLVGGGFAAVGFEGDADRLLGRPPS
ncbi:NAD(P)-dependent oxidoreductase [soil metagenome]